jgi:hypothetical protein
MPGTEALAIYDPHSGHFAIDVNGMFSVYCRGAPVDVASLMCLPYPKYLQQ